MTTTYLVLLATFIVAAALAAIPVAIILGRLGFATAWAGLLFVILVAAPFLPGYLMNLVPASVIGSISLPALGGILKIVEWAPALVFLWVFALRKSPAKA